MTTWHRNYDNYACSVMPTLGLTRNPVPAAWLAPAPVSVDQIMDLSPDQERRVVCTHEAAHAVMYMAYGHRVESVTVHADQETHGHKAEVIPAPAYGEWSEFALYSACGERASDRWLREAGLWTPERAWAVEREAGRDREQTAEYVELGAHGHDLRVRRPRAHRLCGDRRPGGRDTRAGLAEGDGPRRVPVRALHRRQQHRGDRCGIRPGR